MCIRSLETLQSLNFINENSQLKNFTIVLNKNIIESAIYNFAKWMCAKYPPRQYRIKCQMIENWIYEPMRKKKKRCVLCFPSRICWVNSCAKSAYEKETNDDDWWRVYINERKYTTRYIYLCFVFFFFSSSAYCYGSCPTAAAQIYSLVSGD